MPKLVIENGPARGRSYVISKDGPFFAGRDPAAQVPIPDEMVSRRHFQIELREKVHHVRDLESANGTFLNGQRVRRLEALTANDRIQIGETIITYQADAPHPLLGKELGGYRIIDRIGRGGMGTVYRALQLSLDRPVALKILAPHLVKNANFINLFIREARAAGGLSHPNIVQVYDVGVNEDVYYYSMELIPHGSVEDIMNEEKRLSVGRALRVVRDAALGLQYAEQKGIIHRDIKPGNLMVGTGGIIKIGDLGIARSTGGEERISQKDGVSGSPHYIAPEQARGEDIDHRVDLYALGVSFYHMICGQTPFTGSTPREVVLKQIRETAQPIRERVPGLPSEIDDIIARLMAKDPDERVASADALLEELEPLVMRFGDEEGNLVTAGRWKRVLTLVGATVVLAAAASGAVIAWNGYQEQQEQDRQLRTTLQSEFAHVAVDLDQGRLDAARSRLDALEAQEVPGDLQGRIDELENRYVVAEAARQEKQRQADADRAYAELENEHSLKADEASIRRLREFAKTWSDTAAGTKAKGRADELQLAFDAQQTLEAEAEEQLQECLKMARKFPDDFVARLDQLAKFEGERFATTAAHKDWVSAQRTLLDQLDEHWSTLQVQLSDRESVRPRDALARVQSFITRHEKRQEFSQVVGKARSYKETLATEIEALNSGQAPGAGPDVRLHEGLRAAWKVLAVGLDVDDAISELPARSDLTEKGSDQLKLHREFLDDLDETLRRMDRTSVPSDRRTLTLTLTSGDAFKVTIEKVEQDRITYRSDRRRQISKWDEITAESRVEILSRWATTPRQRLDVGFLARINGETAASDRLWEKLGGDPGLETVRDRLKALVDGVRAD